MNIVVHRDGTVEYQDVSAEFAIKLATTWATTLEAGRLTGELLHEKPAAKKKRGRPKETEVVAELTPVQMQTWKYLVAHDNENGVSTDDYARAAKISVSAAYARLWQLIDMHMAHRLKNGHYRPGEKTSPDAE